MSCDCDYGGGDGDVSSWRNFSSCWNIIFRMNGTGFFVAACKEKFKKLCLVEKWEWMKNRGEFISILWKRKKKTKEWRRKRK